MPDFDEVRRALRRAVDEEVFPGAVLLVRRGDEILFHEAEGSRSIEPERAPMERDTIFDLSSLTKPLATTTAFLRLVAERKLRLDDPVTRIFHNFGVRGKMNVTFRDLLRHSSGLPAWKPYFEEIRKLDKRGRVNFVCSREARQQVFQWVIRESLEYETRQRQLYGDLDFLLLGHAIEQITSTNLDQYCNSRVFPALDAPGLHFIDLWLVRTRRVVPNRTRIAPTEHCPWRGRVLCGEVHDDNAWAMGGVAGHAGLFGSAADVDRALTAYRDAWAGEGKLLPRDLVREALTPDPKGPPGSHVLGWDTPSGPKSAAGTRFSPKTVGHLGFTGTSMWLDLDRGVHVVLLTNRVHPSRSNDKIRDFRPLIHDRVLEAID